MLEGLGGLLSSGEGRRAVGWEGRGVLTCERLVSSPGGIGVVPAWGGVPPSLAWLLACKGAGEVLASPWGGTCLGRPVVFPGGHLGDYLPVSLRVVIMIMIIIIWISIRPCYISFLSDS